MHGKKTFPPIPPSISPGRQLFLPILVMVSITLSSNAAVADSQAPLKIAQLVNDHQQVISHTPFLSVQFQQEVYLALRKKSKIRKGHAQFAKPDKFRWSFTEAADSNEEFIFDGKTLSHFSQSENTVTHYGLKSGFAGELKQVVDMIIDPQKLLNRYRYEKIDKGSQVTTYHMVPQKPSSDVKKLAITMEPASKNVTAVMIEYQDGNRSTYQFSHHDHKNVPEQTFHFVNPGHVKEKRVG